MGLDRLSYKRDALLIEASRILMPQFNPIAISLTGAQVELLRNATAVFHKESTFVSTYHDTYYYTASTSDFDAITSLVADLELKLMGTGNVTLGYEDRVFEEVQNLNATVGTNTLQMDVVPSGYVYFIQLIGTSNGDKAVTQTKSVATATSKLGLDRVISGAQNIWHTIETNNIALRQGDSVEATFAGCDAGDDLFLRVWGYRMCVPT